MGQRPMAPVKSWAELKAHRAEEAQAPQAREGGRIWRLWPRTKDVWRYAANTLGPLGQSLQIPLPWSRPMQRPKRLLMLQLTQ